jgi:hypothetical protein
LAVVAEELKFKLKENKNENSKIFIKLLVLKSKNISTSKAANIRR